MRRTNNVLVVVFFVYVFMFNAFAGEIKEINFGEPGGEIEVSVGGEFAISLESNQTTGYKWQFAKPVDIELIKYEGTEYIVPETGMVGAGGMEKWTFKALKEGTAMIVLKYVRPWERDKYPLECYTYIVKIAQKDSGYSPEM